MATYPMREGQFTQNIYSLIRDAQFKEASDILKSQLLTQPNSRAGLSLLAYCDFNIQEFLSASESYQKLCGIYPNVTEYRFQYAVCLYKAGSYDQALIASFNVDDEAYVNKVRQLQAAIRYTLDDLTASNNLLQEINKPEDPTVITNQACVMYKEGNYKDALDKFKTVYNMSGYKANLAYNMALCYFRMGSYAYSLKSIADIIERGIRLYPELSVGMRTEGIDVRSVGNTSILHESAFVEAFNLKAAIEFNLKNFKQSKEALTDMPPRSEEELDPVTLHNVALMNMEQDQAGGFEKLRFLVKSVGDQYEEQMANVEAQTSVRGLTALTKNSSMALRPQTGMAVFSDRQATAAVGQDITSSCPMHPQEALSNLILLLIKYDDITLAADTLTEYRPWAEKYISPHVMEFIDAVLLSQEAPVDAANTLELIAQKNTNILRKLMKKVTDARAENNDEKLKTTLRDYETEVDQYLPVLMAHAKIYWEQGDFSKVENLFRKSVEFCNDQEAWRINVAHTMFVQNTKFTEASNFYEPLIEKYYGPGKSILDVEAVVLANLCVCYIMTSRNDQAEELMRKIEKEEEELAYREPDRKLYHLCIVDLVIGTLYCSKGNFEFGLSRVIKSLEPYNKKLGPDTWYYCKRCFLSLVELLMQEMIVVPDETIKASIEFLSDMESYGKEIVAREGATINNELGEASIDPTNTISWEARQLKSLLISKSGWH